MGVLRKSLLIVSVPLVLLVLVGTIRARVDESTDQVLRDLKVFSEAVYLVDTYYVEEVRLGQLERGAFQGLAESLDPWSSYWDPARMKVLAERDESGDVGLLLVKTPQQYVVVASVLPGSPAAESGVRQGQYLETIDELATKDLTLLEAQRMLRGPVGTTVALGYFRDSPDATTGETVDLERRDLEPLALVVESPDADTRLVRVTHLRKGIGARLAGVLRDLQEQGVHKLILDLRTNVGGDPSEAVVLADLFLGPRPVFQEHGRGGTRTLETTAEPLWSGELVTLIARGTVGEAELVAEALRAAGVGTLVGQPTFGKRNRQELVRLRDGSGIQLSVAEFRSADGEALPEDGVQPLERVARHRGPETAEGDAGAEAGAGDAGDPSRASPDGDSAEDGGAAPPKSGESAEGTESEPADEDRQLERALEILAGKAERKAA